MISFNVGQHLQEFYLTVRHSLLQCFLFSTMSALCVVALHSQDAVFFLGDDNND